MTLNPEKQEISQGDTNRKKSLLDVLRGCPIDDETWKDILNRSPEPPREISFDDDDDAVVTEIID